MKSLEELGVMSFIANQTASLIAHVPEGTINYLLPYWAMLMLQCTGNSRLAAAIMMIIWIGGTAGAFIDNIPFTQTMIPIVLRLTGADLGLPLTPLVWALVYGCCMSGWDSLLVHMTVYAVALTRSNKGNATLLGASANVVAAGLAEQQGYNLSFNDFLKTGLPCCVVSLTIATLYLLITHVLIAWY